MVLDFDVDIVNLGCIVSWAWPVDFVLQLLLPIIFSIAAFLGYAVRLARNKIQPDRYSHNELHQIRNKALASSLKFLNVVYEHFFPRISLNF